MSFKKIKELRQANKLDEALERAEQALEKEPENIWNKRAAAWVYYDLLKKYNHLDSFREFKKNLIRIQELNLPEEEKMVFDNSAWQIAKMIFALNKKEHQKYKKINKIFKIIRDFHFTKPSEAYTLLYKSFHKGYKNWPQYLEFADWWDFSNFMPEDYKKSDINGKSVMSVVEQAFIAYSKMLLAGKAEDNYGNPKGIELKKVRSFIPKLDQLIEDHPEYQYPPYYKARLLLISDKEGDVLSAFLPFARKKRNEFWVWDLMADIFSDDEDIRFACYCKALSLKTQDDFLVNLRLKFAEMLIDRKLYNEARTEIDNVIAVRSRNEWSLPYKIKQWIKQDWYKAAKTRPDNKELYLKNTEKAEEVLFHDIPEVIVAVEFVNRNKHILSFVKNKEKSGFFIYEGRIENPEIGDILKVRFHENNKNGFHKVLTVKKAEKLTASEAVKKFKGRLKMNSTQTFGFVDAVFIGPDTIKKYKLTEGDTVNGKAVLSFNKKKENWGWKMFEVDK